MREFTLLGYTDDQYYLMTIVISFLGFCLENLWLVMRKGYMDNRNMRLPFLIGYGAAVNAMYIVLGTPDSPSALLSALPGGAESNRSWYMAAVFLSVSAGEVVLGYGVRRLCGIDYWDYTSLPMHITRYTSVPTSICFTLIITLYMGYIYQPLMEYLGRLPAAAAGWGKVIVGLMVTDLIASFGKMRRTHELNERYRISLRGEDRQISVKYEILNKK
ncbi:MAG: putative ABC transporter permease [Ruminococcus sp.]|nr:putative ABC transporter permease [Ruminococcus sp.]